MPRNILALGLAGLLGTAGCFSAPPPPDEPPPPPPEPKPAFVVSNLIIPADDQQVEAFGQDFNNDGQVDDDDNSLRDLQEIPQQIETIAQIAALFGIDIDVNIDLDLQAEIDASIQGGQLILGAQLEDNLLDGSGNLILFTAAVVGGGIPAFDGSDELEQQIPLGFNANLVDGPAGAVSFKTDPGQFFFALPIGGQAQLLPLQDATFTGTLAGAVAEEGFLAAANISDGSFAGTIKASDFATQLAGLGALFGAQSPGLVEFLDDNGNGQLDAVFNTATGVFDENELSLIFDIEEDNGAPGAPSGFIGGLFRLDRDGNGVEESMGIGLGLAAVSATLP